VAGVLAARRGPGLVATVEGPPGIGKTFLLDRLAGDAVVAGVVVRRAGGDGHGARHGLAIAAQLLGAPPEGSSPGDVVVAQVDAWCQAGPVLLCVDDAHRLDTASIGLLRRLAWAGRDLPLALVIGLRPFPLRSVLDLLRGSALCHVLLPMDATDVGELVRERLGGWPAPALAAVLDRAAGNPLFVLRFLEDLQDRGLLVRWDPDRIGVSSDPGTVPAGLEDVVLTHLGQLDDAVLELLQAQAVLGPSATLEELAGVLYIPAEAAEETARAATRSGMVRLDRDRLTFVHELYREVVHGALDEATRRSVHRRAAEVRVALRTRTSTSQVTDHHLPGGAGGRAPGIAVPLREAARRSTALLPAVSAHLLADAEPCLEDGPTGRERRLLDRAVALLVSGQGRATVDLVDTWLGEVRDPLIRAAMRTVRIRAQVHRADVVGALAGIEETSTQLGVPATVARELAELRCWVLLLDGHVSAALEEAAALGRAPGPAPPGLLTTLACGEYLRGRPGRALELIIEAHRSSNPADRRSGRPATLAWSRVFELARRGPPAAQAAVERARRPTVERDAPWLTPVHSLVAGGAAFAAGAWDEAVAELDTGLELADEQDFGWISTAIGQRSYIDAHRGRPEQALVRLDSLRLAGLPLPFGIDLPGLADLAVLEALGSTRAATTLARELWAAAPARGPTWMLDLAIDVARVAVIGLERGLLERVATQMDQLHAPEAALAAPVRTLTTGLAHGHGAAAGSAAQALEELGFAVAAAYAWEECACLHAAAGDRERAATATDRAVSTYEALGASTDRGRLLARLRALGVRRGPRVKHTAAGCGWAALTPTERQVADLVRRGLTNPEIAAHLYVSPRTVQSHVSHILAKLDLRSRVEIAARRADVAPA
jgi:DNA-binding CsgD family transcriptional regulator